MKLVIADDSKFIQNIIKKGLSSNFPDAELRVASDGAEGLELWKAEQPDIMITDLLMPNLNGIELIKEIKKINSEAKMIVVSADIQKAVREEAEALGVIDFINKPLNEEKIKQLVNTIRREIENA